MNFVYDSGKVARLDGSYNETAKRFTGKGQWANGNWFDFTMQHDMQIDTTKTKRGEKKKKQEIGKVYYPFVAYGEALPDGDGLFPDLWKKFKNRYEAILIKNATVWTNDSNSVL